MTALDDLDELLQDIAFEAANPGVTIDVQSIQNEDMDGKLQTALNSGSAPDIFLQRGGGKIISVMSEAGRVGDFLEPPSQQVREREPPSEKYPWDGVRNVRPSSRFQKSVVEGVY